MWGRHNERRAIRMYEELTGKQVTMLGTALYRTLPNGGFR